MKRICAWCNKELGPSKDHDPEKTITHGICSICSLEATKGVQRTVRDILNIINEPVFLINHEGVVKAANSSASKMLRKEFTEIEEYLGGEVFECTYAKNEGGCGKTIHCQTCAIRNIVMDTLESGSSFKNVPAFQSIETPSGMQILKFNISTERIGDQVLLRVDSADNNTSA